MMKSNVGLLKRLWAMLYDSILVFSLVFVIGIAVQALFSDLGDGFFYLVTLPSTYAYFAFSWVKGRQTLGMKALKIQVVQENGQNMTHAQALLRFVLAFFSFASFGLGFLYQLVDKNNLTFHDKFSHTRLQKN